MRGIGMFLAVWLVPAANGIAHHSFAVHFNGEVTQTIEGTVVDFRFRNPHGMIAVRVSDVQSDEALWKIETNSPNILRRRGWSPESIKPGDEVTIVGFPARDGTRAMRVYTVTFPDGRELIGQRPAAGVER